jgi:hypothetical protein
LATSGTGLARGAIGLREVLFQSVTSMAPAGAVALSIAAGATYARHPERLREMKKVFADDVPPEPVPSGGAA